MARSLLLASVVAIAAVGLVPTSGCTPGSPLGECDRLPAFSDTRYGYLGPRGQGCGENFKCYAEPGELKGKCAPAAHCSIPPGPYGADGYYEGDSYFLNECRPDEVCIARGLPPAQRAYYGECLPRTWNDAGADGGGDAGAAEVVGCDKPLPDALSHTAGRSVDYVVTCDLPIERRLSIGAGTVIAFRAGAGMTVRKGGSLVAVGTATAPIKMVAEEGQKKWLGLHFFNTDAANALTSVRISNAGAPQANFGASIVVGAASYGPGAVEIRDCVIDASGSVGLSVGEGGDTPVLEGVVVSGAADVPVEVAPDAVGRLGGVGNRFAGNGKDVARILGVTPTKAPGATWAKLDVPYLVSGSVGLAGVQTIKAGVTVLMAKDAALLVGAVGAFTGSIKAVGTAAEPIVFRPENGGVAQWHSITLANPNNVFEHAEIRGGGSAPNAFGQQANIIMSADAGGSDVSIRDCVIEGSGGWGIYGAGQTITQGTGNVFQNNVSGDITP